MFVEIFHEGKLFWKFSKKVKFCEKSSRKRVIVKTFHQSNLFGNTPTKQFLVDIFQQSCIFLWKFSEKLMFILMEFCQQNIVELERSFVIKQRENL